MAEQVEQIKTAIKQKYDWLTTEEIETCYKMAYHDFIRLSYPSQNKRPEMVDMDFLSAQWVYARMVDILDRAGGTSVTAYKENGVSWTYGGSYIDPMLVAMITPKVGIPK